MNELEIVEGGVQLSGSVAYVPQESWILPTTVRENIVYGRGLDQDWYQQVVSACCLDTDMEQFVDGDLTEVGDRGVTLSGGQKARITLARAVYRNSDIYLLDEPCSAVDTRIARTLLSLFITGLLSDKTVILVTHQLQLIKDMDRVLMLENGRMVALTDHQTLQRGDRYRRFSGVQEPWQVTKEDDQQQ